VPRIPDDLTVSPARAAELGGLLLAEGQPFHAHEVFEAAWKSTAGPGRELWRGLAQIAVGLTHARRGNARGAVALLRRGAGNICGFNAAAVEGPPDGIDASYVAASAAGIADLIERDGLGSLPDETLLLRLRPQPDR
jgi:hypothetical protein